MKIHFAAVIGVDYDMDLAPAWISWYRRRSLDSYIVFLHQKTGQVDHSTITMYEQNGFITSVIDGPYNCGKIRGAYLTNYASQLPPDDILVTADADEFQATPDGEPIDYRHCCSHYDLLTGFLLDRYDTNLDNCKKDPFKQYRLSEHVTGEFVKKPITFHAGDRCDSFSIRSKILAAPAGSRVQYVGSHCLSIVPSSYRILYNCKVFHFCWRRGGLDKIGLKPYLNKNMMKQVYNDRIPQELIEVPCELETQLS